MSTLLGAMCGLVFATGLLCVLSGATGAGRAPANGGARSAPGTAPRRGRGGGVRIAPVTGRRIAVPVGFGVVLAVLSGWPALGLIVGGAAWIVPHTRRSRAALRDDRARLRALASWIEVIRDLFGAGSGIEDALITSQRHVPPAIAADSRGARHCHQSARGAESTRRVRGTVREPNRRPGRMGTDDRHGAFVGRGVRCAQRRRDARP